ncbi:MAG: hypothetical protein KDB27_32520 [Planctomycetales bacterium]|nr:hypothetical protein [Planctomycetales bacterium]
MSTATNTKPAPKTLTDKCVVDACVLQRIERCDYRFVFNKITWHYEAGSLILSGCLPTYYLKQVLQETVRGIDHVEQIHNDVEVVSPSD